MRSKIWSPKVNKVFHVMVAPAITLIGGGRQSQSALTAFNGREPIAESGVGAPTTLFFCRSYAPHRHFTSRSKERVTNPLPFPLLLTDPND